MSISKRLLILTKLHKPHIGGVEKFTINTINILHKKGFSITIITEQFENNLPIYEITHNHEIYRIPIFKIKEKDKKYQIWKWVNDNRNLLNKTDYVHVNDVYYWLFLWKLLPVNWGRKVYLTFYGWEGIYPIPPKNILVRKISEKMASGNICIGDFIAKWYHTKPDIVSYGGVNPPQYPI